MEVVFIDTNIIIDFITRRKPFGNLADIIFSLADQKEIALVTSSLSFANTYYMVSKSKINSDKELRIIFRNLRTLIGIIPVNDIIIDRSLSNLLFSDFEDGIQYYAALSKNCDSIITRNLKHFKNSKLPVLSPDSFINKFKA